MGCWREKREDRKIIEKKKISVASFARKIEMLREMYTLCTILKLFLHILTFLLCIYRKDCIGTVFALVIFVCFWGNKFYMSLQFKFKFKIFSIGNLTDPDDVLLLLFIY